MYWGKGLTDVFPVVEISSGSNSHPGVLPRLKRAANSETGGVGNHTSSAQIQTTSPGQRANEREGEGKRTEQT